MSIKLDYTLESPEDRKALVEKILEEQQDNITPAYLEILADYLVLCMEKQEKKEKKILTENRMSTVGKRETSFEGLVSQLENGEDGVYNLLLSEPNKNQLFKPKISITQEDIETIPGLKQLREAIHLWEDKLKRTSGRDAFIIKKALIEMRKEQYLIKQAYQKPIIFKKVLHGSRPDPKLEDTSTVYWNYDDEEDPRNGELTVSGVSLMDPKICSAILCNYSRLKEDSWDRFEGDTWYLMQDFDTISGEALKDAPYYTRLVECKIDGMQNNEIQLTLQKEFGIKHSPEYISSLWRNKIPKMIAAVATENFLSWYYETYNLPMKRCSKCGQFKPAHNVFFSKNKSSKDSLYSICKECRNKKRGY